jgi:diguanylate cyclase (GGDEF)-like protein
VTVAVYAAALALGALSLVLFILAIRRVLGEQSELVATMMERYDERLAAFTQTLGDALAETRAQMLALSAGAGREGPDDHAAIMRTLEMARAATSTDAAIAIVTGTSGSPTVATVGLSQTEANAVTRMGLPDYRGARALEISFNGERNANDGQTPINSGLAVSLVDAPSMLAVLTRNPERRFSEAEVSALQDVAGTARGAIERSLGLKQPDPVPELDLLTRLYDRQSFHALCEREVARARSQHQSLALLVVDVDRLTTINARFGHLAGDAVLEELAQRIRGLAGGNDFPCRLEGGRFAVLMANSGGVDAEHLFESLRSSLADDPVGEAGPTSVSGGVAELLAVDTPDSLLDRAEAALKMAKGAGGRTVVSTALR